MIDEAIVLVSKIEAIIKMVDEYSLADKAEVQEWGVAILATEIAKLKKVLDV